MLEKLTTPTKGGRWCILWLASWCSELDPQVFIRGSLFVWRACGIGGRLQASLSPSLPFVSFYTTLKHSSCTSLYFLPLGLAVMHLVLHKCVHTILCCFPLQISHNFTSCVSFLYEFQSKNVQSVFLFLFFVVLFSIGIPGA